MSTQPADHTSSTTASPRCEVVDLIILWGEVQEGDLLLWDGEFRCVEHISYLANGSHAVALDGESWRGIIPAGTYAAVRRYLEG